LLGGDDLARVGHSNDREILHSRLAISPAAAASAAVAAAGGGDAEGGRVYEWMLRVRSRRDGES